MIEKLFAQSFEPIGSELGITKASINSGKYLPFA